MLSLNNVLRKIVLITVILSIVLVYAQSGTGTISGRVIEKKSGTGLPGANILVKGTYYGTATDMDGNFEIRNISQGSYDLEVTMIGYKVHLQAGVNVRKDETIRLNIEMEETVLAIGQEVVVVGEKPILQVDQTSSSIRFSKEELSGKIAESVTDIIAEQVGVVESDNEIHIRGGRVDESQFIVDGLSLKDPLSGTANNLYVNPNAISELEFISGGFNAEYGQAMSGIIDVKLKEGNDQYEGSLTYKTDHISSLIKGFNTNIAEFTLGGSEPTTSVLLNHLGLDIPGDLYFFISGYMNITDTYLPIASEFYPKEDWQEKYAARGDNSWSWMSKLTWKITPKHKFSISQNNSLNINPGYFSSSWGYEDEYQYILKNYLTVTKGSNVTNLIWNHTLSSRMFYEVNFGKYLTYEHAAVQNKWWYEYSEALDLYPVEYSPLNSDGDIRIYQGDEYWDSGDDPDWYDYYSDTWSLDFDLSYIPSSRHSFKAGFESKYTEMQVIDIYNPWVGTSGLGESWDMYKVYPIHGAFYAQDRIVFEGMIVNAGFRYDYWFPGKYIEDAIANKDLLTITNVGRELFQEETFNIFGHRVKGHFSPRLGISHPVTDNDVLYFNYGHFSQLPTFKYVYAKLNSTAEATYNLIGNPNLNPKTTVSYELGIKHKFNENSAIEFKAYYKDMFDYETSQSITATNPKLGRYSLLMYVNMDYARARGLELIFRQRYGRYFTGDLNASYSITTGKSSTPNDNLLVAAGLINDKPIGENYLKWDQPVSISGNLRIKVYKDTPPRLFGFRMPNNWGTTIHFEFESGKRYTSSTVLDSVYSDGQLYLIGVSNTDRPYSEIGDYISQVDIKLNKQIFEKNHQYLDLFFEVRNIFDTKIPAYLNPFTGEAYDSGEPVSYSYANSLNPNYDPSRYKQPRTFICGFSYGF